MLHYIDIPLGLNLVQIVNNLYAIQCTPTANITDGTRTQQSLHLRQAEHLITYNLLSLFSVVYFQQHSLDVAYIITEV